jgi:hypothetical protein
VASGTNARFNWQLMAIDFDRFIKSCEFAHSLNCFCPRYLFFRKYELCDVG